MTQPGVAGVLAWGSDSAQVGDVAVRKYKQEREAEAEAKKREEVRR